MSKVDLSVPFTTATRITLVRWLAADGDTVQRGCSMCELEAESMLGGRPAEATAELPSPATGVLHHGAAAGTDVEMGSVMGWIDVDDGIAVVSAHGGTC